MRSSSAPATQSSPPGTGSVSVAYGTIQGRDEEAFALYERAIAVADAVGEPVSAGYAHAYRGILRAERGDGEAALADLGPVMERSVASAAGLAISPLQLAIAYTQASAGLLEQARASLQEGLEQGAAAGPFEMASSLSLLARTELGLGLLDSAAEHARQSPRSPTAPWITPRSGPPLASCSPAWPSRTERRPKPRGFAQSTGHRDRARACSLFLSFARRPGRCRGRTRQLRGGRAHPRRR